MKFYLIIIFSLATLLNRAPSDAIIGEYWAEDKSGKIAVFKCENKYCGRIIWRKENGKDTKNPDERKRDRDIVGSQFLHDFQYNADEKIWDGGSLYSFDDGNTYKGKMWLEDSGKTLKMRGYIGFSLMGKTATFKRVN
ncbi:MAG: DUF2147 domain-containing protein [Bacteroidota bacterium]